MYETIITHNDFDGVASAVLCDYVFDIGKIIFTGPSSITRSEISISSNDIVCDLPYPLECGLWFDHHQGNLDDLKYRNIEYVNIDGLFLPEPSCARVIDHYFNQLGIELPAYFNQLLDEVDIIDAFNYRDIAEWRATTPGKIVDASTKCYFNSSHDKNKFLFQLVRWLKEYSLGEVAGFESVAEKYEQYRTEENEMMQVITTCGTFLPKDKHKEIVILDTTTFKRRPHLVKNLAFLLYPDAKSVVEIGNTMYRGVKSNNLTMSMSLSLNMNQLEHTKDIGEIMRELNIGDGHAGAAAGNCRCETKQEMLKRKDELLNKMFEIWLAQN